MTVITPLFAMVNRLGQLVLQDCSNPSPQIHFELLRLIDQLKVAVETPTETVQRLIYQPPQNAALRSVIDLGIFPLLMEKQHQDGGVSATQLAENTGAERELIGMALPCFPSNEYHREYARSPMQWAVGQSQFDWPASRKNQQTLFNSYMASRWQGQPMWFDVYPVERLLGYAVPYEDTVFLVGIGGKQGHDLTRFRQAHANLSAPSCARAYYFRAVFHDWPNHICQQILRNTVSAMAPDYSRILIVDFVLPDTDESLLPASLDIQMMSIGAGVERSESQWRDLLQSVGLEITGIWNHSPSSESVIEAVPMMAGQAEVESAGRVR
ncbi:uncharacterized protein N7482_007932 [Penicillium canariense]|uniref:O-methyltransferase C-terminal domain-containing protein n=1 Tax=Penicillium canariense TaxID=189055 RepID=A0A9W9HXT9_9EURO|nr:uncharacterized protein N7482_007932 [Penicillium canariense]KAJ5160928.1 hypothetical protein N7482_007932 [Penicillium canariense]